MKKIISIVCVLIVCLTAFPQSTTVAHAEDLPPLCNVGRECLEEMVDRYAKIFNTPSEPIKKTIMCESGWNSQAVNWQDSHALSQGSHGIAQFSKETIAHYGAEIGMAHADPYNPEEAIQVMSYMFSIGESNHWTCFRKIYG